MLTYILQGKIHIFHRIHGEKNMKLNYDWSFVVIKNRKIWQAQCGLKNWLKIEG